MEFLIGKTYLTAGGIATVKIVATDLSGSFPIGGILTDSDGNRTVESWGRNGAWHSERHSQLDLTSKILEG